MSKTCPRCHSRNVRPARRTFLESLLELLLLSPYRCQRCFVRFWRFL
jgi:hypothetical protein